MSCILCEKLDAINYYPLNDTITLHSMTPLHQFFDKIMNDSVRFERNQDEVICESCFDHLNKVDKMEVKIKEIINDLKSRYKKGGKVKEKIIISSADQSEIYSVITVDDGPEYFDFNETDSLSPKDTSVLENTNGSCKNEISNNILHNSKEGNHRKKKKIHFTNQQDLKNILNMKEEPDDESEKWNDDIPETHNIGMLYDMMDEKNVGIYLEPVSAPVKKTFKCKRCDAIFSTKQEMKLHIDSHEKDKPYICEVCGKVYRHKSALNIHIGMHNGITPFKCLHCNKTFTQKGAMIRHNKIHTGEKPYQCEECGKCFTHHTSFTIHKISHTGEKSYKCNVCGLMLMSTSHLKRHMRVHTGEKSYSCNSCGKRFAEKYNLMSHSKLHLNDDLPTQKRKFRCDLCNYVFYKRLHLQEHMKKYHVTPEDIKTEYC